MIPGIVQEMELEMNFEDGSVQCLKCHRTLSSMINARSHYKEIHMTERSDRKFACPLCDKTFAVRRYMADHMRKTHGVTQT